MLLFPLSTAVDHGAAMFKPVARAGDRTPGNPANRHYRDSRHVADNPLNGIELARTTSITGRSCPGAWTAVSHTQGHHAPDSLDRQNVQGPDQPVGLAGPSLPSVRDSAAPGYFGG